MDGKYEKGNKRIREDWKGRNWKRKRRQSMKRKIKKCKLKMEKGWKGTKWLKR